MKLDSVVALVTGGASGLGEATVRAIVAGGGKTAILDLNQEKGSQLAMELKDNAIFALTDVTDENSVQAAIDRTVAQFGKVNVVVNCAGIAPAAKVLGRKGPMPLENFETAIKINLTGSFNVLRLAVAGMVNNEPNEEGERGVIINTASIAAFEGQIGQAAYSASKGGIVGMTLPIARELAEHGIRVVTIAPGLFETPLFAGLPEKAKEALATMTPFPPRLGKSVEYAQLAMHIINNPMLNGCTLRLDGALRMEPK